MCFFYCLLVLYELSNGQMCKRVQNKQIGFNVDRYCEDMIHIYISVHLADAFIPSDLQRFIHTFTHRRRSQPRKVTAIASGAGRVRCLAQGHLARDLIIDHLKNISERSRRESVVWERRKRDRRETAHLVLLNGGQSGEQLLAEAWDHPGFLSEAHHSMARFEMEKTVLIRAEG